jgi:hypothetical protein
MVTRRLSSVHFISCTVPSFVPQIANVHKFSLYLAQSLVYVTGKLGRNLAEIENSTILHLDNHAE